MEHSNLKYKNMLEAKAVELAASLGDRGDIAVQTSAEEVEKITLADQRDLAVRLIGRSTQLQREVKAAFYRLAEGTFGRCEQCERDIPAKRLNALPWARHCVACQEALDRQQTPETFENFRLAA